MAPIGQAMEWAMEWAVGWAVGNRALVETLSSPKINFVFSIFGIVLWAEIVFRPPRWGVAASILPLNGFKGGNSAHSQ